VDQAGGIEGAADLPQAGQRSGVERTNVSSVGPSSRRGSGSRCPASSEHGLDPRDRVAEARHRAIEVISSGRRSLQPATP
jgi:hypothetical protein